MALIVYSVLPPLTLDSLKQNSITTVFNGIYTPKEATTRTGAPEDINQRPVLDQKEGPKESLAMVPLRRSAQQEQLSNPNKVPVGAPSSKKERVVIPSFRDAISRAQKCPNAAALNHPPMADLNVSSSPLLAPPIDKNSEVAEKEAIVQVEPDIIEGPTEFSLEKNNALQIDHETTEEPAGGQTSTGAEDNGPRHTVPQTNNTYTADRTSVEVDHEDAVQVEPETVVNFVDSQPSATASITSIPATAQKSKAPCRTRPHSFMHRFQPLGGCRADRIRVRDLKMIREKRNQNRTYQQAIADCVVEAQCGMTGLEIGERAEGQVRAGPSTVAAISQPARVDSAVEAEGRMDGLEFYTPVDEEGDAAMPDAPPEDDIVDETMIGSDVDGEMEVDSDEDSEVDDGEPMDVSEEGHNVEASNASASNPVANAGHSDPMNIAGPSNLMAIEPRNATGKVNLKALQDRLQREKEIALRNTSHSGGMASGSSSASAHLNQQHAAPATLLETGNAVFSMPPRVAQSITSTNSPSELREARLGKRAESRVVQEEMSAPASIASSPSAATNTEDENKSETTQSTNTPTSTLPSSTSSTAPSSPPPIPNVAPQAPTDVSSRSNPTQATTVKRKLPVKGTEAGKAETHQTPTSPAALPREDSPAESSKKARSKPPPPKTDAASEDEVAPLSNIPDDRGRKYYLFSKAMSFSLLSCSRIVESELCACFQTEQKMLMLRNRRSRIYVATPPGGRCQVGRVWFCG